MYVAANPAERRIARRVFQRNRSRLRQDATHDTAALRVVF